MSDTPPLPRRWGVIEDGTWRNIPRAPLEHAKLGPPPFVFVRETDGREMICGAH
jgi:hypothetical protein